MNSDLSSTLIDAWQQNRISQVTYLRRDRQGTIVEREPLDPTAIKPLLDFEGNQAQPPYPAWQYGKEGEWLFFTLHDIEITLIDSDDTASYYRAAIEQEVNALCSHCIYVHEHLDALARTLSSDNTAVQDALTMARQWSSHTLNAAYEIQAFLLELRQHLNGGST